MSSKSLLMIATLALSFQAFALSPADGGLETNSSVIDESLKMGPKKMEAENKADYRYITQEEITLKGLVLRGEAREKDALAVLPQEVILPKETAFHIEDRTDDGEGNRFVKIAIETGDEANTLLSYWVNEGDFVRALYSIHQEPTEEQYADLNLDKVDGRDAKFSYGDGYAVAGSNQFMMPVMGARRSSPPGWRIHPIKKIRKLHAGWDLAAPTGTPVMAAADGVVETAGWGGGYGNLVTIRHGKLQTRYGHLSKILVRSGQRVQRGDIIGKVGSTGLSTGPHLHFEQRTATGAVIFDRPNESMLSDFKKGGNALPPSAQEPAKKASVATKKQAAAVKKTVVKTKASPAPKKKRTVRRKGVVKPQGEIGWPAPQRW